MINSIGVSASAKQNVYLKNMLLVLGQSCTGAQSGVRSWPCHVSGQCGHRFCLTSFLMVREPRRRRREARGGRVCGAQARSRPGRGILRAFQRLSCFSTRVRPGQRKGRNPQRRKFLVYCGCARSCPSSLVPAWPMRQSSFPPGTGTMRLTR